jgi:competence protein ComEC
MATPLIPFTIAWLIGIWLASRVALPSIALGVAVVVAIAGIILAWRRPKPRWLFTLALAAILGALRYNLAQPHFDQSTLATYNDQPKPVIVEGVVVAEPDTRDAYTNLRVEADTLVIADQPPRTMKGLVLVQAPPFTDFRYGDRIRAEGRLQAPANTGEFDYREYLARQGVYSIMSRPRMTVLARDQGFAPFAWLYAFKAHAKNVIAQILPEPQASLLTGILLGDDSGITHSVQDAFRATGTSHIIAISGYNVTILVGLLSLGVVRLVGRRRAFYILVASLLTYMALVGASASVVRAVIMGIVFLFAMQVGRQGLALNALFVTALVMTLYDPTWLWDLGFQLSFVATLGLILYATPLQKIVEGWLGRALPSKHVKPVIDVLSDTLLVTLAAQITTTPLLAYYFTQFSPFSLLTNVLVLPAQPGVMAAGGLALLAGLVFIPLGQVVGWVAWLFLAWTTGVIDLFARIPGAVLPARMSAAWVIGYYALLAAVTWWLGQPANARPRPRQMIAWAAARLTQRKVLIAAGTVVALIALALVQLPDGKLHVYFLDVGQGDSIFIVTPSGKQILVDGGPAPSVVLAQLARHMPFWDHSLDLVIATQPDADHLAGLVAVLERYTVGAVLAADWPDQARAPAVSRWLQLMVERGPIRIPPQAGLRLQIEPGLEMTLLHPEAGTLLKGNDASLVMRLAFGSTSFLLAGDVEEAGEAALIRSGRLQPSTVLKAAHHGSKTGSSPEFLAATDPAVVVISVGVGNSFGHPSPQVLARLSDRRVFRTDQSGTIEVAGDGTRLWVKTQR